MAISQLIKLVVAVKRHGSMLKQLMMHAGLMAQAWFRELQLMRWAMSVALMIPLGENSWNRAERILYLSDGM